MNDQEPYAATARAVRRELTEAFDELDGWFERDPAGRACRPRDGGWTIDELLEHVTLTSHFLLIVIRKGCAKALRRAARQAIPAGESDLAALEAIGHPDAFPWLRPEHMEPAGASSPAEVRARMRRQRDECLELLDSLAGGAGALHLVRMSVQALGKLDLYQWLYFLARHARRHGTEIGRVWAEWAAGGLAD